MTEISEDNQMMDGIFVCINHLFISTKSPSFKARLVWSKKTEISATKTDTRY